MPKALAQDMVPGPVVVRCMCDCNCRCRMANEAETHSELDRAGVRPDESAARGNMPVYQKPLLWLVW